MQQRWLAQEINGAMFARDLQKLEDGKLSIHEAQTLFIDYAVSFMEKGDLRKSMFNTVKNITKVGDANWNHALVVIGNQIEARKRSEQIQMASKLVKKLDKKVLNSEVKAAYDKLLKGKSLTKMRSATEVKLNDTVKALVLRDDAGIATPTEIRKLAEAEERLANNPIQNLTLQELRDLNNQLSELVLRDKQIAEEIEEFGRTRRENVNEQVAESTGAFARNKIDSTLKALESNIKNQKIQNLIIESRKAIQGSALWDLNVEYMAELMGEAGQVIKDTVIKPLVEGKIVSKEWKFDSVDEFSKILKDSKMNLKGWSDLEFGGIFGAIKDKDVKKVELYIGSTKQTVSLTYDEAANFMRVARDEDGFNSLVGGGLKRKQNRTVKEEYKMTADDVFEMLKNIPEEVRQYAFEVGDAYFNDYELNKLNKLGNKLLGHEIATEGETYTHLKKDFDDIEGNDEQYGSVKEILNRSGHNGVTPGSLKSKQIASELNKVGGEAIADKLSKSIALEMSSASAGRFSDLEKKIGAVRGAYTVGKLGLRLGSAVVQNTSSLLYGTTVENNATAARVMAHLPIATAKSTSLLIKNKFNVEKAYSEMTEHSPEMRERLQSGFAIDITENSSAADVKRFLATHTGDPDVASKLVRTLSPETAMGMIRMFDAKAMYEGWELAKKEAEIEGYTEGTQEYWDFVEERHNEFTRKTQPTFDNFDKTGFQGAPGLRNVLMFASFRSKLWQVIRKGTYELTHGDPIKGAATLATVVAVQGLSDIMKQAWRAAQGKETPEDEEWIITEVNNLLRSNVLFGAMLSELVIPALDEALGTNTKLYQDKSFIQDIQRDMKNLANAIKTGDDERKKKAIINLLGLLKIPASAIQEYKAAFENIKE